MQISVVKVFLLKVLPLSFQAACESLEQFCPCPCRSPLRKSVSFVCPNGIIRCLGRLLLYVILSSFFECSTSKIYPAFVNRSIKSGIFRVSIGFMFFTSINSIRKDKSDWKEHSESICVSFQLFKYSRIIRAFIHVTVIPIPAINPRIAPHK